MKSASLSVSFWHVGLENIPEGNFVHRRVMPEQAKRLIEEARHAGTLFCASHDDLLAPYNEREKRNHEALCRVLGAHHGIALSFEDFVVKDKIDGEDSFTIQPLALVAGEAGSRAAVLPGPVQIRQSQPPPGRGRRFEFIAMVEAPGIEPGSARRPANLRSRA